MGVAAVLILSGFILAMICESSGEGGRELGALILLIFWGAAVAIPYLAQSFGKADTDAAQHGVSSIANSNYSRKLIDVDISNMAQVSQWELLHRNPTEVIPKLYLLESAKDMLESRLLGPKRIEHNSVTGVVVLRRSRLQYESHIGICVCNDRHGFTVAVPTHKFNVVITCPRVVPDDLLDAPWDDLLESLCKIDRSIIRSRNSKSSPLTYNAEHGQHPLVRIEVLSKKLPQQEKSLD